jgi:hypothetical protein
MLIADTRCLLIADTRPKLNPARSGVGTQIVACHDERGGQPLDGADHDHQAEGQRPDRPAGQEDPDHHPHAADRERHAHAGGGQPEPVHRVRHVHRLQHEPAWA